jgi:hypothetical protein
MTNLLSILREANSQLLREEIRHPSTPEQEEVSNDNPPANKDQRHFRHSRHPEASDRSCRHDDRNTNLDATRLSKAEKLARVKPIWQGVESVEVSASVEHQGIFVRHLKRRSVGSVDSPTSQRLIETPDDLEERLAIMIYDGGLTEAEAFEVLSVQLALPSYLNVVGQITGGKYPTEADWLEATRCWLNQVSTTAVMLDAETTGHVGLVKRFR